MVKTNDTSKCLPYRGRVKAKLFLSLFISPTLLAGCIMPLPVSEEPVPFDDDEMSLIVPGETDRKQVIAVLGEPFTERLNGSLALYGSAQRVGGLYTYDPFGGKEVVEEVEAKHLVLIRYDAHGVVQDIDVFRSKPSSSNSEKCIPDGVCIRPRFVSIPNPSGHWNRGDSRLVAAYFYDTPDSDASAKSTTFPPNRCAIYVYFNEEVSGDADVLVSPVGNPSAEIRLDTAGYFLWWRAPGSYEIRASAQFETPLGWTSVRKNDFAASTLSVDCLAGRASFVRIDLGETWTKVSMSLSLDDPQTGSDALKDRRLILGQ